MAQIEAEFVLDVEDRSSRDEFYSVDVVEVKKLVSDFARSDARSLNRMRIDKFFGQKGWLFRGGSQELWWPDGSGVDQALTRLDLIPYARGSARPLRIGDFDGDGQGRIKGAEVGLEEDRLCVRTDGDPAAQPL